MRKIFLSMLCMLIMCSLLSGCGRDADDTNKLYVYNWGEYIEPEVLDIFEEETGIQVIYDEFETNESMYSKISSGAGWYDRRTED